MGVAALGLHPMTLLTGGNTSSECLPLRCPDHGFVDIINNSVSVTEAVYSCEEGFLCFVVTTSVTAREMGSGQGETHTV